MEKSLPNNIFNVLKDRSNFDVTIICQDGKFRAHRLILSCSSPFLQELLLSKPTGHVHILLPDYSKQSVASWLKFLYSGSVEVGQDILVDVHNLVNEFVIQCNSSNTTAEELSGIVHSETSEGSMRVDFFTFEEASTTKGTVEHSDSDETYMDTADFMEYENEEGRKKEMRAEKEAMKTINDAIERVLNEPSEVEKAVETDPNRPQCCKFCKLQFLTASHLEAHISDRHRLLHSCENCGEKFPSGLKLKKHMKTHHSKTSLKKKPKPEAHIQVTVVSETEWEAPDDSHSPQESTKPPKRKYKPRERPTEKNFFCSYCMKSFYSKWDMYRHERVHTQDNPYPCSYCDKTFRRQEYCARHENLHTGEKVYRCGTCSKAFSARSHCIQHEMIHSGVKPYACDFCGQMFARKSHLADHRFYHIGDKPHKCSVCNKGFSRRNQCKAHELIHSGEKAYTCTHCSKKYATKKAFQNHELKHKTANSGEQSFICCYCGASFLTKKKCDDHERNEHDVLYSCSYCDKLFKTPQLKKLHETNKHKEKVAEDGGGEQEDSAVAQVYSLTVPDESGQAQHIYVQQVPTTPSILMEIKKEFGSDSKKKQRKPVTPKTPATNKDGHEKTRSFFCEECGRGFFSKWDMTRHARGHSDERPYSCSFCEKTFRRKEYADKHEKTHSRVVGADFEGGDGEEVVTC